jgi:hypothetical protein
MRLVAIVFALATGLAVPVGAQTPPPAGRSPVAAADPVAETVYRCRIGRPSYCFKHGQSRCPVVNDAADKAAACGRWTEACLACHDEVYACLGRRKLTTADLACGYCQDVFKRCMDRNDARNWRNRSSSAQ